VCLAAGERDVSVDFGGGLEGTVGFDCFFFGSLILGPGWCAGWRWYGAAASGEREEDAFGRAGRLHSRPKNGLNWPTVTSQTRPKCLDSGPM
jgi:hypothetical protein